MPLRVQGSLLSFDHIAFRKEYRRYHHQRERTHIHTTGRLLLCSFSLARKFAHRSNFGPVEIPSGLRAVNPEQRQRRETQKVQKAQQIV